MAKSNYVVMRRFNGIRMYVSSTRPLNGGWVGIDGTERKSRAQRLSAASAKRLAAQLNAQDSVGWRDWVAVPVTQARTIELRERF